MTIERHAGRWQRLGRSLATIAVFLAAGPLVGLVTFAAAVAGYGLFSSKPGDYAASAAGILVYGLFFAHFMGAVPAIVTGGAVAAIAAIRRTVVPITAGAAIGGVASFFALSPERFDRPSTELASVVVWLIIAIGMIAGAVCTRLTRRFQLPPN